MRRTLTDGAASRLAPGLGGNVRTPVRISLLPVVLLAVAVVACSKSSAPADSQLNDDLKRDLQLASSTSLDLASKQSAASFPLTEVPVTASKAPSTSVRKAAGPKAVRSKAPTVKATPEPTPAVETEEAQVESMVETPSPVVEPEPAPDAPAVPRPSPVNPVPAGDGSWGRGGNGGGTGGSTGGTILGGIFGVVIRGGGVDGDRCEIHDRRGRNRPTSGGVYIPASPYPSAPRTGQPRAGGDAVPRRRTAQ